MDSQSQHWLLVLLPRHSSVDRPMARVSLSLFPSNLVQIHFLKSHFPRHRMDAFLDTDVDPLDISPGTVRIIIIQ